MNSVGRARAARRGLRPRVRHQPLRLRLLHGHRAAPIHNRVSRFTASAGNPDVATAGSEVQIFNLPNLSSATNHNGGAIHFGPDGKLYVAVGENANGANAPSLNTALGKMLRINRDGTHPRRQPVLQPDDRQQPRHLGARPAQSRSRSRSSPARGRMHINDVGQNTWEEVNLGIAGRRTTVGRASEGREPPGLAGVTYPTAQLSERRHATAPSSARRSTTRRCRTSRRRSTGATSSATSAAGSSARSTRRTTRTVSDFATGINSLVDRRASDRTARSTIWRAAAARCSASVHGQRGARDHRSSRPSQTVRSGSR